MDLDLRQSLRKYTAVDLESEFSNTCYLVRFSWYAKRDLLRIVLKRSIVIYVDNDFLIKLFFIGTRKCYVKCAFCIPVKCDFLCIDIAIKFWTKRSMNAVRVFFRI
jgi:hypothetical protein